MTQKKKKFTIWYKVDGFYTAEVPAESLEEALEKARGMSQENLNALPGDVQDETVTITGVME